MNHFFKDKTVLITGSCGSVGQELVRQMVHVYAAAEVIGLDNNESDLFFQEQEYAQCGNTQFFLADVRDSHKIGRKMAGVDVVFHAAAFKHVGLCEKSPFEAVQTNILGVQNIIQAACANRVGRVIFTSSDKAVNPTNVMGTSKLMGERLMTAANSNLRDTGQIFASTRFGNVLGSRGSVIPIFRQQIKKGGPVTLTDPEMTRFIMSIRQAVQLVIDSAAIVRGGEVFVTKMPVIRILDLAHVMIEEMAPVYGHRPEDIRITTIGTKPGEKLYEELMNDEETRRTIELPRYFAIYPAFSSLYRDIDYTYPEMISQSIQMAYNSANETALSKTEVKNFLLEEDLLEETATSEHPDKRYWGDKEP
ncbi:MAG: SDR family NAD(P)-dependent oxidoreductase [Thermodesulfobacteriota bacterium]|nr:SDR family NAD(P)-dependent oxidoreductase [Thermodesulfobacteriota bacterium]